MQDAPRQRHVKVRFSYPVEADAAGGSRLRHIACPRATSINYALPGHRRSGVGAIARLSCGLESRFMGLATDGTTRTSPCRQSGWWNCYQDRISSFTKQAVRNHGDESDIVIIGAGGTAADILSWLVLHGAQDLPITIVANQASLYTRVDSVFENRLFSDDTRWQGLSSSSGKHFLTA